MNDRLFNVAVIWHPTEKQVKDEGLTSKILVAPRTILAKDIDTAKMSMAMEIPADKKDQLSQIQIAVADF